MPEHLGAPPARHQHDVVRLGSFDIIDAIGRVGGRGDGCLNCRIRRATEIPSINRPVQYRWQHHAPDEIGLPDDSLPDIVRADVK
jgi:hypothetical protein